MIAAAALAATAAPATTISFSFAADDGAFLGAATGGAGSFTTATDTGTFTAADLSDFAIDGMISEFIFDGIYHFGLADLSSFSATLAGGTLTALAFSTTAVTVPLFFFSDDISIDLLGLGAGNLLVSSTNNGAFVGDLTIDGTTTVPEPAGWAMLVTGFGMVGGALRRRRISVVFA